MIILIGCFGNHPFDKAMERELYRYLEECDRECEEEFEPDPDEKHDIKMLEDYESNFDVQ